MLALLFRRGLGVGLNSPVERSDPVQEEEEDRSGEEGLAQDDEGERSARSSGLRPSKLVEAAAFPALCSEAKEARGRIETGGEELTPSSSKEGETTASASAGTSPQRECSLSQSPHASPETPGEGCERTSSSEDTQSPDEGVAWEAEPQAATACVSPEFVSLELRSQRRQTQTQNRVYPLHTHAQRAAAAKKAKQPVSGLRFCVWCCRCDWWGCCVQ